jgi:hypothetical protein
MGLPVEVVDTLLNASPAEAWINVFAHALAVCRAPLDAEGVGNEVQKRDRELAGLDLVLSAASWDLWSCYEEHAPRTAQAILDFWMRRPAGKAILILDALSLRELPWLLQQATERDFTLYEVKVTGAELPGETNAFAHALGFAQRSALENNSAGSAHKLKGARTDCTGIPFKDCAQLIDSSPDWVLWHQWPDDRVHDLANAGQGLPQLAVDAATQLGSDDFWTLVAKLCTGRRLVITTDHGYAASGLFPDTNETTQVDYLKARFKSGRVTAKPAPASAAFVPPLDLVLDSAHGEHAYVLGRRKWKSPGGYPTLAHGGLSVLEMAVPFVELSQNKKAGR